MHYQAKHKRFLVLLSSIWIVFQLNGQDIESIIKEKPFKLTGSIQASTGFFDSNQSLDRRTPFSYYLVGSPTISIYGISIPLSFSIRDNEFNFSKSINRIGTSPKYKWIQLHFGRTSFSFSPYTLTGQEIKGYGITLTPGNFKFTAMKGTIHNYLPQLDTLEYGAFFVPTYERKVLGSSLGFSAKGTSIDLNFFKAKDDLEDAVMIPDSLEEALAAEENLAIGVKLKTRIAKVFSIGVNLGGSVITDDQLSDSIKLDDNIQRFANNVLAPNRSTRFSVAGDLNAQFQFKKFGFGVKYQRVEPHYRTLGAIYMLNDFENITGTLNLRLLKNKLNMNLSYGIQHNNLNGFRSRTNNREIGSVSLNFMPGKVFSLSANYSDFSQEQEPGLLEVNDTLRFAQLTKNLNVLPRLIFANDKLTHTVTTGYMVFDLLDISDFNENPVQSKNSSITLNYNIRFNESKLSFSLGGNYNTTEGLDNETSRYGGSIGVNKKVKKKMSLGLRNSFNLRNDDTSQIGFVNKTKINLRYKLTKKHSLSFDVNYLIKTNTNQPDIQELRGNASYGLSF